MSRANDFTLVLGHKSESSWSLRGWLILKHAGVAFDEVVIRLDRPASKHEISQYSPSTLVPCLQHDQLTVWDTLAIAEYINELYPERQLWPQDRAARAIARSVVAEMHAGFSALRRQWTFDILREKTAPLDDEGKHDVARILEVWTDCRARFGRQDDDGFLFGNYTLADIFYAPVVSRLRTYGWKDLPPVATAYMKTIWDLPAMQEWIAQARAEVSAETAAEASHRSGL